MKEEKAPFRECIFKPMGIGCAARKAVPEIWGERIYPRQKEEQTGRPEVGMGLACLRNRD